MTAFKESPEWELGELAAKAVRDWLKGRGHYVLPVDHIEFGGAPVFESAKGRVTVPDILAARTGRTRWFEVKWKTSCVLHQRTRTWRHGIDAWNWEQYLRVQEETGLEGLLAIVQLRPGPTAEPDPMLFVGAFNALRATAEPHAGNGDEKVWWDLEAFWYRSIQLNDGWKDIRLAKPRVIRPWEQKGKWGYVPRWFPKEQP